VENGYDVTVLRECDLRVIL